jgi:hypothetical protein
MGHSRWKERAAYQWLPFGLGLIGCKKLRGEVRLHRNKALTGLFFSCAGCIKLLSGELGSARALERGWSSE